MFIQRFAIIYLKHLLESFLKLVKGTLSYLGDISQVQIRPLKTPADSISKMFESIEIQKHLACSFLISSAVGTSNFW